MVSCEPGRWYKDSALLRVCRVTVCGDLAVGSHLKNWPFSFLSTSPPLPSANPNNTLKCALWLSKDKRFYHEKFGWRKLGLCFLPAAFLGPGILYTLPQKGRLSVSVKGFKSYKPGHASDQYQIMITRSCSVIKTSVEIFLMSLFPGVPSERISAHLKAALWTEFMGNICIRRFEVEEWLSLRLPINMPS